MLHTSALAYPRLTSADKASFTAFCCAGLTASDDDEAIVVGAIAMAFNLPNFSANSLTMRVAIFGPIPSALVIMALSPAMMASSTSAGDKAVRIAIAALAPTPCTVCSNKNVSFSCDELKPNKVMESSLTIISVSNLTAPPISPMASRVRPVAVTR